jgi:Kef-type K+ transport system membrane component KefB
MVGNNFILMLVVQTGLILALSRVMGLVFVRFRQPQVMGEMIAGIMLGPSLFGWLLPHGFNQVFPAGSIGALNALSQVGVIFFLFLIGLELDLKLLKTRGRAAVVISNASIITPFAMGILVTFILYHRIFDQGPTGPSFLTVALFMGAAMSITAFPVLARILTERNLHRTPLGAITITCAAVDDVSAWCILAFVIAVARATGPSQALFTAAKAAVYVAVMWFAVRPLLKRLELFSQRRGGLSQNLLAIIFLLVLASALATEWIGIHALFGAFFMGAIMPKGSNFVETLTEKLKDFTVVLLLPIFFAYTGLRTRLGLLDDPALWAYTALIILAASAGKFGGAALAARACGIGWRDASAIGILMNTRGLMELVILNIGRDLRVIPDTAFAMMVIMAVVTTALTTPLLTLFHPRAQIEADKAARTRERGPFTVLIPISLPASGGPLAVIASLLAPDRIAEKKIVALHLQRLADRDPYSVAPASPEERTGALEPLLEAARAAKIESEPIAFVSRDVPSDIARVARLRAANLILMGFHKPVFGQSILGGTVHRVMTASDCDVAVFVDRGNANPKSILAPYLGGKHDRLALELAGRIARNANARLTVLHVVPPKRSQSDGVLHARSVAERTFSEPGATLPMNFKVIEDASPVDAVIGEAGQYDLVVIGVEEQWGIQSHLFGWRPERIAHDISKSLLIVRKYSGPIIAVATKTIEAQGALST